MSLTGIQLSAGIVVGVNKPIDAKYGPYADTSAALAAIGSTLRYIGLTVGIKDGEAVKEYWFRNGVANGDLELKDLELSSRVSIAEGEIDSLQSGLSTAQSDISSLAGSGSTSLANAVSSLEAADADLASDISGLDTRLVAAEGDIDTLQSDLDAAESAASSLAGRVTFAEADIDALEAGKQIKDTLDTTAPAHENGRRWINTVELREYVSYNGDWVELDHR